MIKLVVFIILSIPLVAISWRSLRIPGSHGFYRFFGWEATLWLAISNIIYWFEKPFSFQQIISWVFLFYSLYLLIAGVILLRNKGNAAQHREDPTLFAFEKTTELVETGLFRYIRHPLYGSLLFLSWGIFLKHPSVFQLSIVLLASIMYFLTARMDERECVIYFGDIDEDVVTNGTETYKFSELIRDRSGYRYLDNLGTRPNVYYLPPVDRQFPFERGLDGLDEEVTKRFENTPYMKNLKNKEIL